MTGLTAASPAYAAAMAAIHEAAFAEDKWDAKFFETLLNGPGVHGFIGGQGMVLFRVAADEAEILTIGVTAKRQGIGGALMQAAIAKAKELGAAVMHLEVAAGNAPALALYAALGFTEAGRRRGYYAAGEDAILLKLTLG